MSFVIVTSNPRKAESKQDVPRGIPLSQNVQRGVIVDVERRDSRWRMSFDGKDAKFDSQHHVFDPYGCIREPSYAGSPSGDIRQEFIGRTKQSFEQKMWDYFQNRLFLTVKLLVDTGQAAIT